MGRLLDRVRHRSSTEAPTPERPAEAEPIAACRDRSIVTICGELRSVRVRPADGVSCLEAELQDDAGESVTLIWLGRSRISGIIEGRRLTAHGRIGRRRDERILYNPRYNLDV